MTHGLEKSDRLTVPKKPPNFFSPSAVVACLADDAYRRPRPNVRRRHTVCEAAGPDLFNHCQPAGATPKVRNFQFVAYMHTGQPVCGHGQANVASHSGSRRVEISEPDPRRRDY